MNDLDDSFNSSPVKAAKPTPEDVLGALVWSEPREVQTSRGPKLVSSAPAGDLVFAIWREFRDRLSREGYSVSQFRGAWQISKWENLPEKIVAARVEALALSRATDAEINVPAPEGCAYLGYQRAGIAFGFDRPACLIGDEMGLGKTIQAIGILNACPDLKRVLVICPASLKLNWARELGKWLVRKRQIFVADSKLFPELTDGIVIINYDVLHKHEDVLKGTEWDALIVDEAHYLKSGGKTRRGKMVVGAWASKKEKENGAADIPGITARKRIFLTGTPIANRPAELFPLISYLDPINWPDFFRFGVRYCNGHRESIGRKTHWDFSGSSHLDELQEKLRTTIMIRRLKKDVLTELPPKRRQVIEIPTDDPELRRLARSGLDRSDEIEGLEAEVELAEASEDPAKLVEAVAKLKKGAKAAFEEMSTLRQETGVATIPYALAHIREVLEEKAKLVIFGHHKEVLAAIKAELGDSAVMIVGDTPMDERQRNADRFQNDPTCTAIIGSFGAMGVGWTLTAAEDLVTVEQDWVPGNVSQAEDRIHRIGQKGSVLIQHLVLEGSLGATIMKRIVSKQNVIDAALDKVKAAESSDPERAKKPRTALSVEAEAMTDDQGRAAVEAIQILAGRCNGARDWDGMGFSKIDTRLGKELAAGAESRLGLSRMQRALCLRVVKKYARTQLPEALAERLKGGAS